MGAADSQVTWDKAESGVVCQNSDDHYAALR